jgi:hypothetical protein
MVTKQVLQVKFQSKNGKTYWKEVKTINLGSMRKPTRGIVAFKFSDKQDD